VIVIFKLFLLLSKQRLKNKHMKAIINNKVLVACFAASILLLSSCVDNSIDLKNLSTNIAVGGTIATPIAESNITVANLVSSYKPKPTDNIVINEKDGAVNLFFADTLDYTNPAQTDFSKFGIIHSLLTAGGAGGFVQGFGAFPVVLPNNPTPVPFTVVESYKFNDINKTPAKQRVDSMRFKNTIISVAVTSSINFPAGFASLSIQLPPEFVDGNNSVIDLPLTGLHTSQDFPYPTFVVKANGSGLTNFPITVKLRGNGVTPISATDTIAVNISLKNSDFVAYGFFNNDSIVHRSEDLKLNLYKVLPKGCVVYPVEPQITFNMINTNVGIPLQLNIEELKTYENSATPPKTATATFNGSPTTSYALPRATAVDVPQTSSITLDQTPSNGNLANLFKIKVDSASVKFNLQVMPHAVSNDFVSTDSKMRVIVGINVPFWLDAGSMLTISDTTSNSIKGILNSKDITKAVLKLNSSNKLPVDVTVFFELLDANNLVIPTAGVYKYTIKAATVDADGVPVTPTVSNFNITYDSTTIADLKKATKFKITVQAKGMDINSKMKFRMQDYINIKIFGYAQGGISLN